LIGNDFQIKIVDFGLSSTSIAINETKCGTTQYMAPEMFIKTGIFHPDYSQVHNEKWKNPENSVSVRKDIYNSVYSDIFALGVILFNLVSGEVPFEQANKHDAFYKKIINNRLESFWKKSFKNSQKNE
jgi:serine/threonine protein kinase